MPVRMTRAGVAAAVEDAALKWVAFMEHATATRRGATSARRQMAEVAIGNQGYEVKVAASAHASYSNMCGKARKLCNCAR
jgi:3-deoxy-D-manno-octulosonate 8-phosphate phosphatase KdsC-like HAD superfamily phosphatase